MHLGGAALTSHASQMPDQQQVEGHDAAGQAEKAQAVAMVSWPHELLSAVQSL